MAKLYLSRRNLLSLLSKLDRKARGEQTHCTIVKNDTQHPLYPQSIPSIVVTAVEDDEYYAEREPGDIHPEDDPDKALHQKMIDLRIACYDAGYPASEARYGSIAEYEQQTGRKFNEGDVSE